MKKEPERQDGVSKRRSGRPKKSKEHLKADNDPKPDDDRKADRDCAVTEGDTDAAVSKYQ